MSPELENLYLTELVNTISSTIFIVRKHCGQEEYFDLLRKVELEYMTGIGPDGSIMMDFSHIGEEKGIAGIKELITYYRELGEKAKKNTK